MTRGAAHDRTQPRKQLLHAERFWQIVVGAGIDAVDPLGPAAARGEDYDRHPAAIRSPAFEHGESIHAWQAEIENDHAVILGIAAEPCFFAVARRLDQVARSF